MNGGEKHEKPDDNGEEERISWHPAFLEAIRLELDEWGRHLEFISEYQLTTEPLRVDLVIIKKEEGVTIDKNIARIFRKDNLVEYKSPDDHVSVHDFYLVYGYACLYASLNKADIGGITLTFVESRYPQKLVKHLRERRGYAVEEKVSGIYSVSGDILPIQIIDSRKLSSQENIWLKGLDNRLDTAEMLRITEEIQRRGKDTRIQAYLDVITRANLTSFEGVIEMGSSKFARDQVFVRLGLTAEWEARGRAEGEAHGRAEGEARSRAEIAKNLLKDGFSEERTAQLSGLDIAKVKALTD